MNSDTPVTNYDALALGPAKRKRGRPRKYPMLEDQSPTFGDDARMIIRDLNMYAGGNINLPPRLQVNGSQPHSMGSIPTSNDIPIGQTVSGVIEASFDGGYLLAVRAGKSETTMRGVVFKPGRYVPVSAENDVAPDVKMIKRSEIPPQSENLSNLHASGGRSKEKNGAAYHQPSFSPSTLMPRGGKLPPSVSPQAMCTTPLRGNVVPVVLQPITSTNGSIIPDQPCVVAFQDARLSSDARLTPSVPIQGHHSLNGSAVAKASGNQESGSADGDQNQYLGEGLQPRAPFENLVTEVIKRIRHPTSADGNQNESSKSGGKSSSALDDESSDADDQPLFVEPLQTLQPVLTGRPNIIPQKLDNDRTVTMTQLLQAVQESAAGNVFSQTQNLPARNDEMSHAVDRMGRWGGEFREF